MDGFLGVLLELRVEYCLVVNKLLTSLYEGNGRQD
jgi:hypothetical protein